MNVRTASVCTANPEVAVSGELLHRLASDDAFRARLEWSPAEVLAEYQLAAPGEIPVPLTLPSKEDAQRALTDAVARGALQHGDDDLFVFIWIC